MFQIVFKILPCYEYFVLVINFCTFCSNVERNQFYYATEKVELIWHNRKPYFLCSVLSIMLYVYVDTFEGVRRTEIERERLCETRVKK